MVVHSFHRLKNVCPKYTLKVRKKKVPFAE
jgi:hypothetical protein